MFPEVREKGGHNMTELLYFILGIAFAEIALPVVESFISFICMKFELSKGKIQLQMMKIQQEIDNDEVERAPAIGFDTGCCICREDEEEEPEEEEE